MFTYSEIGTQTALDIAPDHAEGQSLRPPGGILGIWALNLSPRGGCMQELGSDQAIQHAWIGGERATCFVIWLALMIRTKAK
jgi:hypothetical protein